MLIEFKIQNFRSFLTEQVFSFATSSHREHESTHLVPTGMKAVPRLSKAAAIFGPNAGGKTNLLVAFATFRDLVLYSTSYSDAQFAEHYTPFRFGPSLTQPTVFDMDLLLGPVRYRYSISYDSQRIRWEKLLVYRTGKSQRWFERHFELATHNEAWAPFSPSFNGPREMWRKATRSKALFLSTAVQLKSEQLAPLVQWMENSVDIVFSTGAMDVDRSAARMEEPDFKRRMLNVLRAVDIRIDDLRLGRREPDPRSCAGVSRPLELKYARKGAPPVWLDSIFEAAGTRRLLGLLGPLIEAIEGGKLLLIDEFDASLHPLVARFLIQLINDPKVSHRGAQLLLTSHNTTLMDLEFLRRDEIWLVRLNEDRTSSLSPLVRSRPRKHELVAKNYLRGRYGAVPRIRPREPV